MTKPARGAPVRNTLQRNWLAQIEQVWDKRGSYRCSPKDLMNSMHALDARTTPREYDFRKKLDGRRTSSEAFARILFRAARLSELGCSEAAFIEGGEAWLNEIGEIDGSDLQDVLGRALETTILGLEVHERPRTPHAGDLFADGSQQGATSNQRRIGAGNPPMRLSRGAYMRLVLQYRGDAPLLGGHVLALERDEEDGSWQVFNAVPGSGIDHCHAVLFTMQRGERIATIDLKQAVQGPSHPFELYVAVRREPFSPWLVNLVDNLEAANGIANLSATAALADLLRNDLGALMVARARYDVG